MKKKIIFNINSLVMGGEEMLGFQYLNILKEIYDIELIVNENHFEDNIFEKEIPKEIKYTFVIDEKIMERTIYYKKERNKNFFNKVMYNIYLSKKSKNFNKNFQEIIKNKEYDLMIDFSAMVPNEILNSNSISWSHFSILHFNQKRLDRVKDKFLKTGKIIVVSNGMKKEILSIFPELDSKIEVLYNMFDFKNLDKLSEEINDLPLKEKLLLNSNYIIACSRLDKNKDLTTLINAYNESVLKYNIQEKLYIVGDGVERSRLEDLVASLSLKDRVFFLGNRKNPYIWFKNAKLFIHTSRGEGFGRVLIEAMYFNVPVIATDCPVGPREILQNGECGILVEVGDYKEISVNINKILTDTKLKENIVKKAKKRIEEFSEENLKLELKNIIENMRGN